MEPQPWGKANPKLCQGLHFFSAVMVNSEKNSPSARACGGVCDLKQEAKLSGYRCSPSAQQHKLTCQLMPLWAETPLFKLLLAAFDPRETWPQLLWNCSGQAGAAGLSPEEIRYSTEGQDSTGAAYPAWHWALLIPKRGFRKEINLENGNEFTGANFLTGGN